MTTEPIYRLELTERERELLQSAVFLLMTGVRVDSESERRCNEMIDRLKALEPVGATTEGKR